MDKKWKMKENMFSYCIFKNNTFYLTFHVPLSVTGEKKARKFTASLLTVNCLKDYLVHFLITLYMIIL